MVILACGTRAQMRLLVENLLVLFRFRTADGRWKHLRNQREPIDKGLMLPTAPCSKNPSLELFGAAGSNARLIGAIHVLPELHVARETPQAPLEKVVLLDPATPMPCAASANCC